jgi:DNA-directed DNA polymerase III PolC
MYLNCHSCFSFKYGVLSPEELLQEAEQKNISALALTDINNTSGILEFFKKANEYKIRPIAGIEFRIHRSRIRGKNLPAHFIGIAQSQYGFHELNKYLGRLLKSDMHSDGPLPEFEEAFIIYLFQHDYFPLKRNEYIGVKIPDLNRLRFSEWKNHTDKLVTLAPVTFRNKIDFNTHRLLRAIDNNTLLSKLPVSEQASPDEVMFTKEELTNYFREYPQLVSNAERLLEQCEINFEFKKNKNKIAFSESKENDKRKLEALCAEGLHYRYPNADSTVHVRLEKELRMIYERDFASYFLINWDIVKYAQSKNFFYVGRGSGANSIVAYLLRITDVDPIDLDLYFERFINPSRINPPDFDIDFSWQDRDEIINHIFKTYGEENTALLATYNTFQSNSVIRELGKVFGLPKGEIDLLADRYETRKSLDNISQLIFRYSERIKDLPSHLSIHSGGILISENPITYYTALSNPPKNFPLTQFSMLEAEDVGLYKFDILSQRGLGKIKGAIEIIRKNRDVEIDIHDVNRFKTDEKVEENLRTANLMGCFYVESPAMRMLLTKLEARTYLDLVAASSIIRPGVASSGMMREYILRFQKKPPSYKTPEVIMELLKETFGVMVYQEDVIKVAYEFANLTLGEADMLRRGMSGKFRAREEFKKVKQKFFENCKREGHKEAETQEVWRQIESFAGYAFSKGHSASYAVESYQCMFLKTYYPLEFMVSVLNNDGGFYSKEAYVHEAKMKGATIHVPDINKSECLTTISDKDIFLGFDMIIDFEKHVAEDIVKERTHNGVFSSLEDFMNRIQINIAQLRLLIRVGAFSFTKSTKKQLLWDIHSIIGAKIKTEAGTTMFRETKKNFCLPELYYQQFEDAWDEIEILGFPLCSRFQLLKEPALSSVASKDLKNYKNKDVSVVGFSVTYKSTSTKHRQKMAFGTYIDRNGDWIDTTHFPEVLKKYPIRRKGCYLIKGKVVEEFNFYSIDVTEMQFLDPVDRNS